MFFDRNFMMRHLAFPTQAALKRYLVEQTPAHAYYSSAYYEKPDAPTMPEKNWLAADLLFDLDADHVEGAKGLSYEDMLKRVKQEVLRLIDVFLLGDLGFDEDDLKIVFSGGRGYHVHVHAPRVMRLSSHERREIVDYVTGTDLDLDWVFPRKPFEQSRFRDTSRVGQKRSMPDKAEGGWKGRIRAGIEDLLDELEALPPEEAKGKLGEILFLSDSNIGPRTVDGLYDDLFSKSRSGRCMADRIREEGIFEAFSNDRHLSAFLEIVRLKIHVSLRGETDEPVTSDIRRLIRLPSSIHGKTGFEVVVTTREGLDSFDPFRDAVPDAFGEDEVKISCEKPVEVSLKGERYGLGIGENAVPAFVATHLICRNLAAIDS